MAAALFAETAMAKSGDIVKWVPIDLLNADDREYQQKQIAEHGNGPFIVKSTTSNCICDTIDFEDDYGKDVSVPSQWFQAIN